jgi:predicted transcriptional regulator
VTLFTGKRCELDIINDILSYANKDIKKTRLLYKTNLSYTTFSKYTHFLIHRKFLGIKNGNPSGKVYYTTDEGKKLIKDINKLMNQLR